MRLVAAFVFLIGASSAATLPDPTADQIDDIIAKFAAKEADFAKARGNYTYRQDASVMSLDDGGGVTGKWQEVTDVVFTPEGTRNEKVVRAPMSTLTAFQLDPGDIQVDEITTYVFAVKPKKMESGQRYFEGEVWVDDHDLQIVKSYGRGVGIKKGDYQYPKFETYREQVDGKYWFPTFTIANATLHFKENDQRMRMNVKYEDYKQFKSDVTIKYGDAEDPSKDPGKTPPPAPKKQQ
jgi:hypothetical protein